MFSRARALAMVRVVMVRKFKPKSLGKEGFDALIKIKQLSVSKPGFLSSEVNVNVEDYHDQLIISNWETLEDWVAFRDDPERAKLHDIIKKSFAEPEDVRVYSSTSASRKERELHSVGDIRGGSVGDKYSKRRLDD